MSLNLKHEKEDHQLIRHLLSLLTFMTRHRMQNLQVLYGPRFLGSGTCNILVGAIASGAAWYHTISSIQTVFVGNPEDALQVSEITQDDPLDKTMCVLGRYLPQRLKECNKKYRSILRLSTKQTMRQKMDIILKTISKMPAQQQYIVLHTLLRESLVYVQKYQLSSDLRGGGEHRKKIMASLQQAQHALHLTFANQDVHADKFDDFVKKTSSFLEKSAIYMDCLNNQSRIPFLTQRFRVQQDPEHRAEQARLNIKQYNQLKQSYIHQPNNEALKQRLSVLEAKMKVSQQYLRQAQRQESVYKQKLKQEIQQSYQGLTF